MSRYTNVDALKQQVESPYTEYPIMIQIRKALKDFIDDAPSIDIVRCGECEHWKESQYYPEFMVCTYVIGATFTRQHDDFCSRGERREP